jgi:DNA-binding response OmpR family regulator
MREQILIIEDDEKIADLVKLYLEKERFGVLVAYDGQEGLTLFQKESPTLIILDLLLPKIDGLTLAKLIRQKNNTPIIMLTAKGEEIDKVVGLELGADDYIVKPFSPKELVARVKAVLRRAYEVKKSDQLVKVRDLEINQEKFEVKKNGKKITLTRREFNLLLALAKTPGKVFSRSDLLDTVYSVDDEVFDRTIDVHITNLRRKLGDKEQKLIKTITGVGYKLQEDDET